MKLARDEMIRQFDDEVCSINSYQVENCRWYMNGHRLKFHDSVINFGLAHTYDWETLLNLRDFRWNLNLFRSASRSICVHNFMNVWGKFVVLKQPVLHFKVDRTAAIACNQHRAFKLREKPMKSNASSHLGKLWAVKL